MKLVKVNDIKLSYIFENRWKILKDNVNIFNKLKFEGFCYVIVKWVEILWLIKLYMISDIFFLLKVIFMSGFIFI